MRFSRSTGVACLAAVLAASCGSTSGNQGGPSDAGKNPQALTGPSLNAIGPDRGPAAGGTDIELGGANFAAGATVTVGGNAATAVQVLSSTRIAARTPPGAAGAADIGVVNPDGQSARLAQAFTYVAAPPIPTTVGACALQFPQVATVAQRDRIDLFGRVFVADVTEASGPGAGVQVQASAGGDWVDAAFSADVPSGGQAGWEEWKAIVQVPEPTGDYPISFRARVNGGPWVSCGASGTLRVRNDVVSYCRLLGQSATSGHVGEPFLMNGEVYVPIVTPPFGEGAGIVVQAGLGLPDGGQAWFGARYDSNANVRDGGITDTDYDGYRWLGAMPLPGTYTTVMRAAINEGPWTLCQSAGTLAVDAGAIAGCHLQFPRKGIDPTTFTSGADTVYAARVQGDPAASIAGQFGLGPPGTDPGTSFGWQFFDADDARVASDGQHQWEASLDLAASARRAATFRFSADGRQTWTYCDQDGEPSSFDAGQVTEYDTVDNREFDGCALTTVSATNVAAAVSSADGGANLIVAAEALLGPPGTDPGLPSWTAIPARGDGGTTFSAAVHPAPGTYGVAFRFRGPSGNWSYAAADGGCGTGFQPSGEGVLTVGP